jgi:ribosomal protein S21
MRKRYFWNLTQAKVTPLEIRIDGTSRDAFEDGFRKFKALVQRERIVGQVKERMSYEKPSEKKRRKRREAAERRMINEMRERMMASGEWEQRQKRKEQKRMQRSKPNSEGEKTDV